MYEPDQDKKMTRNRQPARTPELCRVLTLPEHELDVQVKDGPAVNGDNLEETLHSDASVKCHGSVIGRGQCSIRDSNFVSAERIAWQCHNSKPGEKINGVERSVVAGFLNQNVLYPLVN